MAANWMEDPYYKCNLLNMWTVLRVGNQTTNRVFTGIIMSYYQYENDFKKSQYFKHCRFTNNYVDDSNENLEMWSTCATLTNSWQPLHNALISNCRWVLKLKEIARITDTTFPPSSSRLCSTSHSRQSTGTLPAGTFQCSSSCTSETTCRWGALLVSGFTAVQHNRQVNNGLFSAWYTGSPKRKGANFVKERWRSYT